MIDTIPGGPPRKDHSTPMRSAGSLPPFASFSDVRALADLAHQAERLGWEGATPTFARSLADFCLSGSQELK